jgi:hypothetical protein
MKLWKLLVGSLVIAAPFSAAQAQTYQSYANARYGYAICYPSFMKAQREADNGDGRRFIGGDGGELIVFGRNNVDGESLAATARADAADLAGRTGKVTYSAQRANWAVFSGSNDRRLFYSKTFQKPRSFVIFELTYPKSATARYKEVATRLSRCFRLLP